jgi:hypothetical protein
MNEDEIWNIVQTFFKKVVFYYVIVMEEVVLLLKNILHIDACY